MNWWNTQCNYKIRTGRFEDRNILDSCAQINMQRALYEQVMD
jgi:hypothetical protein